jgi:hypothetical protein
MYEHKQWILDMAMYGPERAKDPLDQKHTALIALKVVRESLGEDDVKDIQHTCEWNYHLTDYKIRVWGSAILSNLDLTNVSDSDFATQSIAMLIRIAVQKPGKPKYPHTIEHRITVILL